MYFCQRIKRGLRWGEGGMMRGVNTIEDAFYVNYEKVKHCVKNPVMLSKLFSKNF